MALDDVEADTGAQSTTMTLNDTELATGAQPTNMSTNDVDSTASTGLADTALNDVESATGTRSLNIALEDAHIPTAVHDPPFRFLDLAAELRNRVYAFCFEKPSPICHPLTQVNQRIRSEFRPLFLGKEISADIYLHHVGKWMQTLYPDVFVNSEDSCALSLPHGKLTVQIAPLWWRDMEQSFDLMPLLQLRERAPHLHLRFDYKLGYDPTGSRYDYRWAYELPEHEQSWIGMSPEQLWNMPIVCDHLEVDFEWGIVELKQHLVEYKIHCSYDQPACHLVLVAKSSDVRDDSALLGAVGKILRDLNTEGRWPLKVTLSDNPDTEKLLTDVLIWRSGWYEYDYTHNRYRRVLDPYA